MLFFVHLNAFIYSFLLQTFCTFCVCSVLATDKIRSVSDLGEFCLKQNQPLLLPAVLLEWPTGPHALEMQCLMCVMWPYRSRQQPLYIVGNICCLGDHAHLTPVKPVLSSAVLPPAGKAFPLGPPSRGSSWTVRILCPHCVTTVCGSTSLLCTEKASDSTGTELEPLLKFPFFMVLNYVYNTGSL